MPLDVRLARESDADVVVGLFRQYLTFYGQDVPEESVAAYLAARRAGGDSVLLVGALDDAVVGFAQVYPTWSSVSLGPIWVLNDLFVSPQGRGVGVGRALVREVCSRGAAAGVVRVSLATAWDNMTAQSLYESEGFVRDADFHHYAYVTGA